MSDEEIEAVQTGGRGVVASVLLFWVGYLALTLGVGFATSKLIGSEVWQLTAWGFVASAALILLTRWMVRTENGPRGGVELTLTAGSWGRLGIGLLVGIASFGVHLSLIVAFAGPIHFEWVPGVGASAVAIYFLRFMATSCMEEVGFRGYTLHRLAAAIGPWPAVGLTSVAFGLSHLSYGWDLRTIALGKTFVSNFA